MVIYRDGLVTVSTLSKKDVERYMNMPVGMTIEPDMIRWVAENENEILITEQTASGLNRIRIKKNGRITHD